MNRYLIPFATLAALSLLSCGSSDNKARSFDSAALNNRTESAFEKEQRMRDSLAKLPPKVMTFEEAMADTLQLDHNVTIEGYLQLPQLSTSGSSGQSLNFFGRRNQMNGRYIYASVPTGSGNNQMSALPDKYLPGDLVISDVNGTKFTGNERVRLTGVFHSSKLYTDKPENRTQYLDVTKIEKVDEQTLDYSKLNAPELAKAESEKEENHDNLYYLEGKLSVPMFVLTGTEMTIDLTNKKGEKFTVKLVTGSGNSMMEDLKENWGPNDVKIRDNKGNLVKTGKNVRVYGVLKLDGLHVEEVVSQ